MLKTEDDRKQKKEVQEFSQNLTEFFSKEKDSELAKSTLITNQLSGLGNKAIQSR
jgi:hypothetical protein